MDVNADTVKQYLTRYGAENLVHGHTHRPADHRLDLPSGLTTRRVLAEWHPDRGEALVWCDGEWRREAIAQESVDSG